MTAVLLPAGMVFLPLLLALVTWLAPERVTARVAVAGHAASLALAVLLALVVRRGGVVSQSLGGWEPPLGIAVRADGLAALFALLTAVVVLAVALHVAFAGNQPRSLWPLLSLLQTGLVAVFVTGDLFNAYVGLEITGLTAVGLVALGGRGARRAALHYLIVAVLGSLFFLVAVGVVYGTTGTLDIALAGHQWARSDANAAVPLGLAATGLALKCALFPLHGWLPPAHAAAPLAASPLLSALVVKAPLVVLLRLWLDVTGGEPLVGLVLSLMGAGAVMWGGLQALVQTSLKRVVAYSTVVQVGYLFLPFVMLAPGVARPVQELALGAVVTLAVAHALAKAVAFLVAGTIKTARGSDELHMIRGMARHWPAMAMALAIAGISLMGLPISAGFVGKWQLLGAAGATGTWWVVAVVLVGTLLSAAYLMRPVAGSLQPTGDLPDWPRLDGRLAIAPLGLALLAFVLGLSSVALVQLAEVGRWGQ